MLTGAVEVYANHSLLVVGSISWPKLDSGDGPADADGRHVAVKTRGQTGHTRVSFWSGSMPLHGTLVFDGTLAWRTTRSSSVTSSGSGGGRSGSREAGPSG